jgi:hypothetical protein
MSLRARVEPLDVASRVTGSAVSTFGSPLTMRSICGAIAS